MVADEVGKGTNMILRSQEVIETVRDKAGEEAIDLLRQPYPFRVPTVFTELRDDGDPEVIWAPIIVDDERMRFRADTIDAALAVESVKISDEAARAFQELRDVITSHPVEYHHLNPGQILVVDNWRVLHGRTAFTNLHRLLHRIRVHKESR
jgi:hypothetical protein